jgi:undecaprenyl diphosphate synthase
MGAFKNLLMLDFVRRIYEKKLEKSLASGNLPAHIMIVADEIDFIENLGKFKEFIDWCRKFGINKISICIHMVHPISGELLNRVAKKLKNNITLRIISEKGITEEASGDVVVNLIAGYGGRAEITDAVKKLAKLVESGEINPDEVREEHIERFLKIKEAPDLIVRAGEEIPDFLIWQSIYSELYFIDVDWKSFRYVDFLRCLRDYQRRERRYGK